MQQPTRALSAGSPDTALAGLVIAGPVRSVTANADGSWTVVPVAGPTLLLTDAGQAGAYIERATHGTGRQALAPARVALPARPAHPAGDEDEEGDADPVGCGRGAGGAPADDYGTDLMQARAISRLLGAEFAIRADNRSVTVDEAAQAAVVHVQTHHGLYTLRIPAIGRQYGVLRNGHRDGVIARRIPSTSDASVALQFGAYLRDRGAL
ncbi:MULTISPECIES: hypothetical protein [unclassified Streptomyces]|uniref:hypothetical protein n=1 Tax=unclassified Streptomyces TaxID=2593676 RepID=UPI002270E820|nr:MULTISPECIES: hypothetical protein [unclassified Streptomyces]MCY0924215.1 hypothetical protein [Streptomyces sp. H27-G5]MCY0963245.1 hypothetical protein [Streptomyces sp. H27-H5]